MQDYFEDIMTARSKVSQEMSSEVKKIFGRTLMVLVYALIIVVVPSKWEFQFIKNETKYWLFSASLQTLGAFIALLFTGYTFIYEHLKENMDDEITREISRTNHNKIKFLTILVGISMIMSLLMIAFNEFLTELVSGTLLNRSIVNQIILVNITLIIYSFIKGIIFVISVLDPQREEKTADSLLDKEYPESPNPQLVITRGEFIDEYIELEEYLRDKYSVDEKYKKYPNTMRSIVSRLKYTKEYEEYIDELHELINYRNLVVHGTVKTIRVKMHAKLVNLKMNVFKIARTGERSKSGAYVCSSCEQEINIKNEGLLPPCPRCNNTLFEMIESNYTIS